MNPDGSARRLTRHPVEDENQPGRRMAGRSRLAAIGLTGPQCSLLVLMGRILARCTDRGWQAPIRLVAPWRSDRLHRTNENLYVVRSTDVASLDAHVEPTTRRTNHLSGFQRTRDRIRARLCALIHLHRRRGWHRLRRPTSGSEAVWSPHGRSIAYAGDKGVYTVASTGGRPRVLTYGGFPAWCLRLPLLG